MSEAIASLILFSWKDLTTAPLAGVPVDTAPGASHIVAIVVALVEVDTDNLVQPLDTFPVAERVLDSLDCRVRTAAQLAVTVVVGNMVAAAVVAVDSTAAAD